MTTNPPAAALAGRYVLGEMIGQGGMSQVWRARDSRLERDVAVKILHPGLSSTPINRERFEREALAAARVNHPNVVAVYDAGEQDGELFIVMECLPGHTLYEELARGPLDVERARSVALQLLRGLGAAHRLGIVHRDIKPGNVLFATDGTAKLADFGIAKFTEGADLTQTGQMIGTAPYLPPERLMGNDASASGDLYSLGIVLYEALAGRRPFAGDTPLALVHAINATTPVPIGDLRPDLDEPFARAITGATEKDPARRFGSAAAMSAALIGAPPPPLPPPPAVAVAPPSAASALSPAAASLPPTAAMTAPVAGVAMASAALLSSAAMLGTGADAGGSLTAVPATAALPAAMLAETTPGAADMATAVLPETTAGAAGTPTAVLPETALDAAAMPARAMAPSTPLLGHDETGEGDDGSRRTAGWLVGVVLAVALVAMLLMAAVTAALGAGDDPPSEVPTSTTVPVTAPTTTPVVAVPPTTVAPVPVTTAARVVPVTPDPGKGKGGGKGKDG